MHFHAYATRVPGHQANGAPGSLATHAEFMTSTVPPSRVRDWLKRGSKRVTATFEAPELAAEWHRRWMNDNPRPDSCLFLYGLDERAEFTRLSMVNGSDRVDSFYTTGGEFVSLCFIPCPPNGGGYTCPEGRTA